jgi:hypothetical protein
MQKQIHWRFFLALILASMLAGCAFSKLEKDLARYDERSHVFAGNVTTDLDEAHAFIVMALRDSQGEQIAGFRVMSGPDSFEIKSDPVPTYFFSFDDLNKDLTIQADEPHGWAAGGRALDPSTEDTGNITIAVTTDSISQTTYSRGLVGEPLENHVDDAVHFNLGTVLSLDHSWFSEDQAEKGLWQPFQFMEDGGSGIHFLEPYDSEKTPILFVHGILDSPRRFKPLIDSLDRSK